MVRHRVRLRFGKTSDRRFLGHRDLARTLERVFRRAGLKMRMSEGFHPKPRMSFPSALALGSEGWQEVVELELTEERSASDVLSAIGPQCPDGLLFHSAKIVPPGAAKAAVERVIVSVPVPAECRGGLEGKIQDWLARSSCPVDRPSRKEPIDIRPQVLAIDLAPDDGTLRMTLRVTADGSVRPREVLDELGLPQLEREGHVLTRTAVELRS